ncbi:MAG: zinc ribbon domain-containing protein [Clostridia bacterium]|nr:zinc ribbon domain-containing protein [Clostridia bacterium]
MKCQYCGNEIQPGATICGFCNSPVTNEQQNVYQAAQPSAYNSTPGMVTPGMSVLSSKKELLETPQCSELKKNLKASAIVGYISASLTFLAMVLLLGNYYALIDVALILGLTLGFHLTYNKFCAIGLLVYSIVNCIIALVDTGSPSGWLIILAAVYAMMITFKIDKVWKDYRNTGTLPNEVIKIK